jgi:hypothetical protein
MVAGIGSLLAIVANPLFGRLSVTFGAVATTSVRLHVALAPAWARANCALHQDVDDEADHGLR